MGHSAFPLLHKQYHLFSQDLHFNKTQAECQFFSCPLSVSPHTKQGSAPTYPPIRGFKKGLGIGCSQSKATFCPPAVKKEHNRKSRLPPASQQHCVSNTRTLTQLLSTQNTRTFTNKTYNYYHSCPPAAADMTHVTLSQLGGARLPFSCFLGCR